MAAPERFAKGQILFLCTAGAVHTWHSSTDLAFRRPHLGARLRNAYDNVQRVARGEPPLWVVPELSDLVM
jgi:hypothetical protein